MKPFIVSLNVPARASTYNGWEPLVVEDKKIKAERDWTSAK